MSEGLAWLRSAVRLMNREPRGRAVETRRLWTLGDDAGITGLDWIAE
jgi:hypothetical protein